MSLHTPSLFQKKKKTYFPQENKEYGGIYGPNERELEVHKHRSACCVFSITRRCYMLLLLLSLMTRKRKRATKRGGRELFGVSS